MAEKKTEGVEVVKQQTLADNAKFTSDPEPYDAALVIIAGCINSTPAPTQPCQVTLELSADEVAWSRVASTHFGPIEGAPSLASFHLGTFANTGAWRHYRLMFGGNVGGAVEIAASTGQAPVLKVEEPDPKGKGHGPDKGHETHPLKK